MAGVCNWCTGGERWTHHHVAIFLLTFCSYALFHATRKSFSNVKASMQQEWLPQNTSCAQPRAFDSQQLWHRPRGYFFEDEDSAESFLGTLDFVFLICYSFVGCAVGRQAHCSNCKGLFVCGALGDRFDPRVVISIGMWLSGVLCIMFGTVSQWFGIYDVWWYALFWAACGLAQSSGWPNEVCLIGNWFGRGSRGFVLGLWAACASIGNILGSYIVSVVDPYGYENAFLVTGSMLTMGGFVVYFGVVSSPLDVGLPAPSEEAPDAPVEAPHPVDASERTKPVNFFRAILLPGVLAYSLAYACLKCVNYSLFFWLPYYLNHKFHWLESVADQMSTWYDWGGIVGGVVGGVVSDHLSSRNPVVVSMLLLATGSLFLYQASPADKLVNGALMAVAGFFIGGPANLISSAVSADLGRQPALQSADALATVTGIIDGTGSVGAALGQKLVPLVQQWAGWQAVFYMFIVLMFATALCLAPLLVGDYRRCRQHQYQALHDQHAAGGPPVSWWRRCFTRRRPSAGAERGSGTYTPLSIDDMSSGSDDDDEPQPPSGTGVVLG